MKVYFKIISVHFCLYLLTVANLLATYRCDDPNAPAYGIRLAAQMPFETVILVAEDVEIASGIALSDRHILTCAHAEMLHSKIPFVVTNSNQLKLGQDKNDNLFKCTLENLTMMNHGMQFSTAKNIDLLGTPFKKPFARDSINNWVTKCLNFKLTKEEAAANSKSLRMAVGEVDGEIIAVSRIDDIDGADLCIITLNTPLTLSKPIISLCPFDPEEILKLESYAIGGVDRIGFSDGEEVASLVKGPTEEFPVALLVNKIALSFPPHHFSYLAESGKFCSTLKSIAGRDHFILDQGLDINSLQKGFGTIRGGMSGGPLVFKTHSGEYILSALTSMSIESVLINAIAILKPHITPDQLKSLETHFEQPAELFDIFQGLTPALIARISEIMER